MKDRVKNTHICCNCKYWEGVENLGECSCPKFVCPDSVGDDAAELEMDGMAQYRNGMSGLFITGRLFGCIHFKEIK